MTNDNSVTECVFPNLLVRTEVRTKCIVPQLITEQSSRVPGSGVSLRTEYAPYRLSVFHLTLFFVKLMTREKQGRVLCRMCVLYETQRRRQGGGEAKRAIASLSKLFFLPVDYNTL